MRQQFVHEMFQSVAAAQPARPALTTRDESLSYGELEAWTNNIAHRLIAAGAQKGAIVYIAASSPVSVVASMLAVLKIGAVFVPIDPASPIARLRVLTEQVKPDFILSEHNLGLTSSSAINALVPVVILDSSKDEGKLASRLTADGLLSDVLPPKCDSQPDDMCYIYFTSGTTGKPKAIAGRLKAIDHFVRWEAEELGVGQGTAVSQLASPVFDAFLRDAFTPLCFGGIMRIPDSRETVLDPRRLVEWLNDSQIELMHTIPSILRTILAEPLTARDFPALRTVALAGEILMASDIRRWREIFGDRVRLVNLYGPSETTMVKLFHSVRFEDMDRHSIPIGKAMPGARALVLDETGRPTAEGMMGEIFIRTPYRSLGYYGQPNLTQEVFVPNPLSDDPSDIVYRTGDLGRMQQDGCIEFLGRRDDQVKIRGIRIEAAEIENAILATGLASDAVVTTRTDMIGNSYLCAYVVSKDGSIKEELLSRLAETIPQNMLPSVLLELSQFPRTATGKIDRAALPTPEDLLGKDRAYAEPRNETEAKTEAIFAQVLDIERVDIHDDFFKLGGHSLLAMTLLSRLITEFEVDLPLASLFQHPTVAEIASLIVELRSEGSSETYQALGSQIPVGPELESRVAAMSDEEVDALLDDILAERSAESNR